MCKQKVRQKLVQYFWPCHRQRRISRRPEFWLAFSSPLDVIGYSVEMCVSACCLQSATVILREAMSVEEFLASACSRKNLNPMEHFLRVKKRKDMEDHNYFVPHRTDLVETYVSTARDGFFASIFCSLSIFFANIVFSSIELSGFRHHVVRSAKFHFATANVV